jgi:hypothetical protein
MRASYEACGRVVVQQAVPGVSAATLGVLQVAQRRGDPPVRAVGRRQVELREDAADVLEIADKYGNIIIGPPR